MWLWLMNFIMLPPKTLSHKSVYIQTKKSSIRTCVMPNARHSSSHSNFNVPFAGSWYSFGMAFSMLFGSCTCRYSNSLSEYLEHIRSGSCKLPGRAVCFVPRGIVDRINELIQAGLLRFREWARVLVSPVVVRICHFFGRSDVLTLVNSKILQLRGTRDFS